MEEDLDALFADEGKEKIEESKSPTPEEPVIETVVAKTDTELEIERAAEAVNEKIQDHLRKHGIVVEDEKPEVVVNHPLKKHYDAVTASMAGRQESDIPMGDNYWHLRNHLIHLSTR